MGTNEAEDDKDGICKKIPNNCCVGQNCSFLWSGNNVVKPREGENHQLYQVRKTVNLKMLETYQIYIVIPL